MPKAPTVSSAPNEEDVVRLIRGAGLFTTEIRRDERGELVALEHSNLGFTLHRVYYIRVHSSVAVRAEHACSAEQVIIVLTGGVTVDLDNGHDKRTLRLVPGEHALRIHSGMWLRLKNFLPTTTLLVAASRAYADTAYYDKPQPHLITGS